MSTHPTDPVRAPEQDEDQLYCYGHPKEPTRLRCTRCDRPICGRCAIPASVGQHCPECVAADRRSTPKVRSAMRATAPAVVALVVVNVLIFIGQQVFPALTTTFYSLPPAIAEGEWWRLFSAMFLHSPSVIIHILFNMIVLWIYGPNVEQAFGTVRFLAMYLIAGFFASSVSYAFGSCGASLGASGAIFGVVGILLAFLYNRRRSQFVAQHMRSLLVFIGINVVIGFIYPGIDYLAHFGGLAGGVALGFGFDYKPTGIPTALTQALTAVAVAGLGTALVIYRTATFTCGIFG